MKKYQENGMNSPRRTRFYLDRKNAKWKGVCAGIADYTGIDVTWVRVGTLIVTLMGAFPWTLIAYVLTAWIAADKPAGLYEDAAEAAFWQGVRQSPGRSTRDVRSTFRDLDRRLADVELHYTASNRRLAEEIDRLK